ncbi:hypothetical protein [Lacinutrix neustonica]
MNRAQKFYETILNIQLTPLQMPKVWVKCKC